MAECCSSGELVVLDPLKWRLAAVKTPMLAGGGPVDEMAVEGMPVGGMPVGKMPGTSGVCWSLI